MTATKLEIRQDKRTARAALSSEAQHKHAHKLLEQIRPLLQDYHHIACYLPSDGEIQTQGIIEYIWQQKKHCYLPKISNNTLIFIHYEPSSRLDTNQWGIQEPASNTSTNLTTLDLLLIPLVAFTTEGTRLGRGGGYYDKLLSQLSHTPKLIGLAHELQKVSHVPIDKWDVNLETIVTEAHIYTRSDT